MFVVANQAIPRLLLPHGSRAIHSPVDGMPGETFPRVQDIVNGERSSWRKKYVNMIRHHDVCIKVVTFAVEMPKGILDNHTVLLCRHQAGTPTRIQRLFEFLAEVACILFRFGLRPRSGMRREPICLRARPFRDFLLRQGVGKAEGREARDALLFPMRKVGARAIRRGKTREETWGRRRFARRHNRCRTGATRAGRSRQARLPWGKRRLAASHTLLRPP